MYFPKNLLSIKSAQAFKDFCLNPKGIKVFSWDAKPEKFQICYKKIIPTSNFEKERKIESFVNFPLIMHRAEKPLDKHTIVFRCEPKYTKPELKQYLEKSTLDIYFLLIYSFSAWVYGLDIKKVNTLNYMGKFKKSQMRSIWMEKLNILIFFIKDRYRTKDFKKVYVQLNTEVQEMFQKIGK